MKGDKVYLFVYVIMFMDSILLTRSTFFVSIHPITWGLALYFLAKGPVKRKL